MKVVPDAVPSAIPTADVQVYYGQGSGFGDHGGEGGEVLAGVMLGAEKVRICVEGRLLPGALADRLFLISGCWTDDRSPYDRSDHFPPRRKALHHSRRRS